LGFVILILLISTYWTILARIREIRLEHSAKIVNDKWGYEANYDAEVY
jgi:hypothetical protein